MGLFSILRGDSSRISTSITPFHDGYVYFTPDDGGFYIDAEWSGKNRRIRINEPTNSVDAGNIAFVVLAEKGFIDPVSAEEHAAIFPQWEPGVSYVVGNLRQHGGKLWKCSNAHTSQDGKTPDVATDCWKNVNEPVENEWPEWSTPSGAAGSYNRGDKVSHGGKHWVSNIDNNVWEPGIYGWTEV